MAPSSTRISGPHPVRFTGPKGSSRSCSLCSSPHRASRALFGVASPASEQTVGLAPRDWFDGYAAPPIGAVLLAGSPRLPPAAVVARRLVGDGARSTRDARAGRLLARERAARASRPARLPGRQRHGPCVGCGLRGSGNERPLPGRIRRIRATHPQRCGRNLVGFSGFFWCRRGGSNSGPTDYESVALPLSYVGILDGRRHISPAAPPRNHRLTPAPATTGAARNAAGPVVSSPSLMSRTSAPAAARPGAG
jgi:hypothetical protein